jgi:hypothetical protein
MSNNAILKSVIKLRYGEIALQPTKELVEFVPVPKTALYYYAMRKWGNLYYNVTLLKSYILAKKGRFIHVRSQISCYVCSMYLGTKGDFFSYTCTFCAHLPRCCALLCGRPLS